MISAYTPTTYVNDSVPAINAANLNHAETAIQAAVNELRRLAGDPALPNTSIALDASVKSGTWTILGGSGANDVNLDWMIGYFGVGISYDGTNWQCPGSAHGNGWSVIGVHPDGKTYLYSDTSTGNGSRSYTKAQFLAKRGAALGTSAPSTLAQEGAADGDVIAWNTGLGYYAPKTLDPPVLPVVATTIGGLGTAVDGKVGLLRLGSTPFTFVTVHYDATYGKWVTEGEQAYCLTSSSEQALSGNTTFVDAKVSGTSNFSNPLAWRVRDTAGLLPQVRLIGAGRVTAGTGTWQASYLGLDTGATATATAVGCTASAVTSTSTGGVVLDSGWAAIPGGYTVKDWFSASLQTKNSGANATWCMAFSGFGIIMGVKVRWVG